MRLSNFCLNYAKRAPSFSFRLPKKLPSFFLMHAQSEAENGKTERGIERGRGGDAVQKRAQVCPGEQASLRNISALRCQHFMKWKFSICQSDGGDETGTNRPPTHTSTNTQTYLVVLLSLYLSLFLAGTNYAKCFWLQRFLPFFGGGQTVSLSLNSTCWPELSAA